VHDFFDIVGLSRSALPVDVRRACARLTRRTHPDFGQHGRGAGAGTNDRWLPVAPVRLEVAVDFVDMASVLDRMQVAFFRDGRPRPF